MYLPEKMNSWSLECLLVQLNAEQSRMTILILATCQGVKVAPP